MQKKTFLHYFFYFWFFRVNKNGQAQSQITDAYRRPEARLDGNTDPVDLYIFTALNVSIIFFALTRSLLFFNLAKRSSTNLHNTMFKGVTRAAMYFFNTNPSGRILNRFSKDLGQVDEILPGVMMDVTQIFLALFGIVVVLCIVNPWYLLATALLCVIFYFLRSFYLNTSRDVKRLEAISKLKK